MSQSALYIGDVLHRRTRPKVHQLDYRVFALLLDLNEIDSTAQRLRLFSRGRFNLLSFRDSDYGDGSGHSLRRQAEDDCRTIGVEEIEKVELFTMPRLLGFAFNPLSLFFCYSAGDKLAAIIHEVHNTFGERHRYVLPVEGNESRARQSADKDFHVSPFLSMDLHYDFRVGRPGKRLEIAINVSDDEGPLLVAVQKMERKPLTDAAILRAVAAMPLMTIKVVAGILWEAARLWSKGVEVHPHPRKRARRAETTKTRERAA